MVKPRYLFCKLFSLFHFFSRRSLSSFPSHAAFSPIIPGIHSDVIGRQHVHNLGRGNGGHYGVCIVINFVRIVLRIPFHGS